MAEIKICGITNSEDARLSAELGADALGFNFYDKSPRFITPENARVIVKVIPANILTVGVFVDADIDMIENAVRTIKLGAVQLHGMETTAFVKVLRERLHVPVIKALRVSKTFKPADVRLFDVDAILLDAYSPALYGGTGETFDWKIAKQVRRIFPKIYLAGGLSPENVRSAVDEVRPFAVDACSSLEVSPGKKDPEKLRRFIAEAKRND